MLPIQNNSPQAENKSRADNSSPEKDERLINTLVRDIFDRPTIAQSSKMQLREMAMKLFYPRPTPAPKDLTHESLFNNVPQSNLFTVDEKIFIFKLIKKMKLNPEIPLSHFLGVHLLQLLNESRASESVTRNYILNYYLAIFGNKRSTLDLPKSELTDNFYFMPMRYSKDLRGVNDRFTGIDQGKIGDLLMLESIVVKFFICNKGFYLNMQFKEVFFEHSKLLIPQSSEEIEQYKNSIILIFNLVCLINKSILHYKPSEKIHSFTDEGCVLQSEIGFINEIDEKLIQLTHLISSCNSYSDVMHVINRLRLILLSIDMHNVDFEKNNKTTHLDFEKENYERYKLLLALEDEFAELLSSIFNKCYLPIIENPSLSVIARASRIQINLFSLFNHKSIASKNSDSKFLQEKIDQTLSTFTSNRAAFKARQEIMQNMSTPEGLKIIMRSPFYQPYITIKHFLLKVFDQLLIDAREEIGKLPNMGKKRRIKELSPLLRMSVLINDLFVIGLNKERPVFPEELLSLILPPEKMVESETIIEPIQHVFEEELHLNQETGENSSSDEDSDESPSAPVYALIPQPVLPSSSPKPAAKTLAQSNLKMPEPLKPNLNHLGSQREKVETKEFSGPKNDVKPDDIRRVTKRREIARILRQLGFEETTGGRHSSHFVNPMTGGEAIVPAHTTIEAEGTRGSIADQAAAALVPKRSEPQSKENQVTTSKPTDRADTKAKKNKAKKKD